jgi:hypothetical protein
LELSSRRLVWADDRSCLKLQGTHINPTSAQTRAPRLSSVLFTHQDGHSPVFASGSCHCKDAAFSLSLVSFPPSESRNASDSVSMKARERSGGQFALTAYQIINPNNAVMNVPSRYFQRIYAIHSPSALRKEVAAQKMIVVLHKTLAFVIWHSNVSMVVNWT